MKLKTLAQLLTLALLWGIAFLFIKVAVREIPPVTLIMTRVGLAAVILYLILRAQGRNLPRPGRIWLHFAVVGLLYNALPYSLVAWSQQHIDSALAAMFIGATPLITLVLAHFFTADDHFMPAKAGGVAFGFAGLAVLLGPALADGLHVTSFGLLASLTAAISYGAAIVYAKRTLHGLPPLVSPTAQLGLAALFLLPVSLLVEQPYRLPLPSVTALGALLLLTVFSTALVFYIYYRAMETTSATTLSLATYLIPIVATAAGVLLLHEQLAWNVYLGSGLIFGGIFASNGLFTVSRWQRLLPGLRAAIIGRAVGSQKQSTQEEAARIV